MSEQIDPMDLDNEEYQKQLAEMLDVEPEVAEVEDVEETTEVQETTEVEETEETDEEAETEEVNEKAEETDEQLFEIVYKGKTQKLTRAKMDELAQKGFSYHADMNRIAPHKKLVALIEGDEEIGKMVNKYVTDRATPKTSKLTDFESEEEWLEDNLQRRQAAEKFTKVKAPSPGQEIIQFFQDKDPDNYEKVLGKMGEHASQLTMAEYKEVNSSMDKLEEFYDNIKGKVLAGTPVKPKQTFRSRSGGGAPPRQNKSKRKAWEMPTKDFNKMIQKVKGY